MPVVTLSGGYGAGAREVGLEVAHTLEADYVDQQILVDAARRLDVEVAEVAAHDERPKTFGERLANLLRNFLERSAAAGIGDPLAGGGLEPLLARTYAEAASETHTVDDERYIETVTSIIKGLAFKENIVIIGRGSQVILKDHPKAVHVLLHAPLDVCIQRIMRRDGLKEEEARHLIHDTNRGREAFHRKFFKVDVNSPTLYDLVIDTGRLNYPMAAEVIALAARLKEEKPAKVGQTYL